MLVGDKSKLIGGSGKVLKSTSYDQVFIYFASHGGSGIIGMFLKSYLLVKSICSVPLIMSCLPELFCHVLDVVKCGCSFFYFLLLKGLYKPLLFNKEVHSILPYFSNLIFASTEMPHGKFMTRGQLMGALKEMNLMKRYKSMVIYN